MPPLTFQPNHRLDACEEGKFRAADCLDECIEPENWAAVWSANRVPELHHPPEKIRKSSLTLDERIFFNMYPQDIAGWTPWRLNLL